MEETSESLMELAKVYGKLADTRKVVYDLQAELVRVKDQVSQLKGYRKWPGFWLSKALTHIN